MLTPAMLRRTWYHTMHLGSELFSKTTINPELLDAASLNDVRSKLPTRRQDTATVSAMKSLPGAEGTQESYRLFLKRSELDYSCLNIELALSKTVECVCLAQRTLNGCSIMQLPPKKVTSSLRKEVDGTRR